MYILGRHVRQSLAPSGSMVVSPESSSTYVFSASNDAGNSPDASVRVEVVPAPAAPAPAAAAPAPSAAAVATPVASEPAAVKAALTRYREAYESESLDDVRKAWPSVSKNDQKNMKTVFDQFNAIRLSLNCREEDIHIDGASASAEVQPGLYVYAEGEEAAGAEFGEYVSAEEGGWELGCGWDSVGLDF